MTSIPSPIRSIVHISAVIARLDASRNTDQIATDLFKIYKLAKSVGKRRTNELDNALPVETLTERAREIAESMDLSLECDDHKYLPFVIRHELTKKEWRVG